MKDVNAVTILINNIFVTWCYHFLLIKWCAVQVNKENPILQTEFGSKNYDEFRIIQQINYVSPTSIMQYVYFKQPAPLQTLNIPCNNIVTDRGAYLH